VIPRKETAEGRDKGKLEYWKEIGMAEIGRRQVLERFKEKGGL
jgi:hypothetical protein